ncbi:unnamed protein product [Heligmosomoides polygyrus]|uniref:Nuclear receptor domain-containing protein n=1 Tax=Heligmosomoides polygyrus TaxID=6339 RepID=A0A183G4K8_HELPZ|nr:unnamed protein product [Heligmosomoides polygyrus]
MESRTWTVLRGVPTCIEKVSTLSFPDKSATDSPTLKVCSKAGHGKHFGVNTCRACAAFFRRSVVQSRTYQCRKGNGSCNLSENEKFVCRYCRFQRCTALGMTPESTAQQSQMYQMTQFCRFCVHRYINSFLELLTIFIPETLHVFSQKGLALAYQQNNLLLCTNFHVLCNSKNDYPTWVPASLAPIVNSTRCPLLCTDIIACYVITVSENPLLTCAMCVGKAFALFPIPSPFFTNAASLLLFWIFVPSFPFLLLF